MAESAVNPPRRAPLIILLVANVISMTGNQLALLAIPWFVLETTGSAVQTGLTAAASLVPIIIAGFFGGTLVDRIGYKRTSVIGDIASGLSVALIPLLYLAGYLEFWMLLVLVFLGTLLDAPGATARSALLPELAELAHVPLERAGSLHQIVERSSRLIGAPLAGGLVALVGAQNVLWLDTITFAVSAALIAFAMPANVLVPPQPQGSYKTELLEGLRFIRRDGLMLTITLLVLITNFLDAAWGSVIMPVFVRDTYGTAIALGLMVGLSGGGAVLGALLYGLWGLSLSRRWLFVGCFIAVGLPLFTFAWFPPLGVVLGLQFLRGVMSGPINPVLAAVEFERIPPHMRGRVFGVMNAGAWSAMPLGVLLAGYSLEGVGLSASLLIVASAYLLTTASMIFNPRLAAMDDRPPIPLKGMVAQE